MKKSILSAALTLFTFLSVFAQIEKPVTWAYAAKKINATEAIVYLKATIDHPWHLYSTNLKPGGPVKTSFTFSKSNDYSPIGKPVEPKPMTKFEQTFKMNVSYFEHEVTFSQKFKINKNVKAIKGVVEFMVCNDKQCLPPEEVSFSVPIK
ncbi:MAG: sugar transporter [Sphingobacteriaceae bacterium]|nr:sugar transporter [Sphingobacteriaceae bacterium]